VVFWPKNRLFDGKNLVFIGNTNPFSQKKKLDFLKFKTYSFDEANLLGLPFKTNPKFYLMSF